MCVHEYTIYLLLLLVLLWLWWLCVCVFVCTNIRVYSHKQI
jgi:hypothetical protein